jgi:hypothetical protein
MFRKNQAAEGGKERYKMNKDINPRQLVNIRKKVVKIKCHPTLSGSPMFFPGKG